MVTSVAGIILEQDEDVGCLPVVGEVVGADFLTEDDCLAAAIVASGAGGSTEDKDDCSLAAVGMVAGTGWLIGGGCLAVVGL